MGGARARAGDPTKYKHMQIGRGGGHMRTLSRPLKRKRIEQMDKNCG